MHVSHSLLYHRAEEKDKGVVAKPLVLVSWSSAITERILGNRATHLPRLSLGNVKYMYGIVLLPYFMYFRLVIQIAVRQICKIWVEPYFT